MTDQNSPAKTPEKKCPLCLHVLNAVPMGEKNDFRIIACKFCGSAMVDPFLTQGILDDFWGEVQPEIVHFPHPEIEIGNLKKLLLKISKKWISKDLTGKRFLDISCRQGYAVMAAKELGMQVKGIDPHEFFIKFAKDKYDAALFEHSSVQQLSTTAYQADLIFSIESFCEQADPETYMAGLAKLLATGGLLYIQEPDGNHFLLPKTFIKWGFIDPPLNFVYYSRAAMESLLNRHGFKIQHSFFTWSPLMRIIAVKK